ncbi:MAG TPA: OB-fold domain-containing protein, partial [Dehalococcoidales bacterium]|nr:OB-fold domain-containing protein [Dehalococcoidales bacterium]
RLWGQKCRRCGFITAPPRLACRQCAAHDSDLWELSGRGRIATFTAVYVPTHHRIGKTPYLVVMVEMEEGPWVMGNLAEADPASASLDLIGRKVRMNNALYGGIEPQDGMTPLFVLEKGTES